MAGHKRGKKRAVDNDDDKLQYLNELVHARHIKKRKSQSASIVRNQAHCQVGNRDYGTDEAEGQVFGKSTNYKRALTPPNVHLEPLWSFCKDTRKPYHELCRNDRSADESSDEIVRRRAGRARSSSPLHRDALSVLTANRNAMSGKGPGKKKRPGNVTETIAIDDTPDNSSSPSGIPDKRDDEAGSDGNEGEVVSARRLKTDHPTRTRQDSSEVEILDPIKEASTQDDAREAKNPEKTDGVVRRKAWSAYERYKSKATSSPDYSAPNLLNILPKDKKMPPYAGGFAPKNTLSRDSQPSTVPRNAAQFDLHKGYTRKVELHPNKKPKTETETRIKNYDPTSDKARRQESDQVAKQRADSGEDILEEKEYYTVKDSPSPRPLKASKDTDTGATSRLQSRSPERQKIKDRLLGHNRSSPDVQKRLGNQEDSKDKVVSGNEDESPKGQRAVQSPSGDRLNEKSQKPGSAGRVSKYFSSIREKTGDSTRNRGGVNTLTSKNSPESNSRSNDHKNHESEDELLHSEPLASAHPPKKERKQDESIDIQRSPSLETRGDIKSTKFSSSKQGKNKKIPKPIEFKLQQLFSPTHIWVSSSDASWTLLLDSEARNLKPTDSNGNSDAGLILRPASIRKMQVSKEDGKLLILKTKDKSFGGASNIHMELDSVEESKELMEILRRYCHTIGHIEVSKAQLEKIFDHQRPSNAKKQTHHVDNDDDEIKLLEKRLELKHAPAMTDRRSGTAGTNDVDSDQSNRPRKTTLAGAMKDRSSPDVSVKLPKHKDVSIRGDDFYRNSGLGDDFYRDMRPSTRSMDKSSSRILDTFRSPSPKRWTKLNPNWTEKWHSSIVFPRDGKNKTSVDMQDIERLDEGEFLNDNLIAFYMRWLQHRMESENPDLAKRIYFHNSFFYNTLTQATRRGIDYKAVERWTARVDLLSYDYIIVPVNEAAHWYVAIICNAPKLLPRRDEDQSPKDTEKSDLEKTPQETQSVSPAADVSAGIEDMTLQDKAKERDTQGHDSEPVKPIQNQSSSKTSVTSSPSTSVGRKKPSGILRRVDPTEPRIVTLDSLGLRHSPTCTNLRDYLLAEIKSKKGLDVSIQRAIGFTATNIPQQDNYCDCGLYVLGYIEKFLEDPDQFMRHIMQKDTEIDITWLKASDMRNRIRSILFDLQEKQIEESQKKQTESIRAKRIEKYEGKSNTTSTGEPTKHADSSEEADRKKSNFAVVIPVKTDTTPSKQIASPNNVEVGGKGKRDPTPERHQPPRLSNGHPKTVPPDNVVEIPESPVKEYKNPRNDTLQKRSLSPSNTSDHQERRKRQKSEDRKSRIPESPLREIASDESVDQEDASARIVQEEEDDDIMLSERPSSLPPVGSQKRKRDIIEVSDDDGEIHRGKRVDIRPSPGKRPQSPQGRPNAKSLPTSPTSSLSTPSSRRNRRIEHSNNFQDVFSDGLDRAFFKGLRRGL